jgi:hypothetical protein
VAAWSGGPPYQLEVAPPAGRATLENFTDRAEWLAAYHRHRAAPPTEAAASTDPATSDQATSHPATSDPATSDPARTGAS